MTSIANFISNNISLFDFPFSFGQKSSLLLIFFFHGIIFSILLLRNGILYQNKSSKWLSLLLFLYTMYITPYMLGYANWYADKVTSDILFFVPFMQVLLIGPVVYFYTKSLLNKTFKLSRREYLHLLPSVLYLIYSLIVFITDKFIVDDYYFYADGRDKDLANWYQTAGLISMSIYLILSLRYYINYRKLIFETVSYADSVLFQWIRNFMIAFLGILILRVLFFILNPEWGEFGSHLWHYISFSFVFYYISVNGYSHAVKSSVFQDVVSNTELNFFQKSNNNIEFRETSDEINLDSWKPKILRLILDEKIYQNPKLTLSDVAMELKTNTKVISSTVNSGFQMNFNDFINYYRVQAVIENLKEGQQNSKTLLGIALECGFNSKATFNRAFKKHTTLSPKEYLLKMS